MQRCDALVGDNIALIDQGIALVSTLGAVYSSPAPRGLHNGIGPHFRHCIDFYNSFLNSAADGRVNYDCRKRNVLIESDPELAALELKTIVERLEPYRFVDGSRELLVVLEGSENENPFWTRSSIARELQSLLSHTVHHYALVAVALRLQGIEPASEFGVAPSTLEYWRKAPDVHRKLAV
jgi:hypothetical protein